MATTLSDASELVAGELRDGGDYDLGTLGRQSRASCATVANYDLGTLVSLVGGELLDRGGIVAAIEQ